MNVVNLRLEIVALNKILEVSFDARLTLKENMTILNKLCKLNLKDYLLYEPNKAIFLDINIPLQEYEIGYYLLLQIL